MKQESKTIKIDNEEFDVPEKVLRLFERLVEDKNVAEQQAQIHHKAVINSTKMLNECKFLVEVVYGDRKETPIWMRGQLLIAQYEAEVRHGMMGWLQKNWAKICTVSCNCGSLISYEAVRETNELICNNCNKSKKPPLQ